MLPLLVTPPTGYPVTLAQTKAQLRITTALDDALVDSRIPAAVAWAEEYTGRQWLTATYEERFDAWPDGRVIAPQKPPLQEVLSVKYLDASRVEQTLAATAYDVDTLSLKGRVVLRPGESWPSLADAPGAVRVRFKAGYADAASVPPLAVAAILLHIQAAHLEDEDGKIMEAARRCLDGLKVDFV